ncbi:MAG: HEAT repeat domain-containing protein [Burkholderiales bacterium]|nr:HEAT repeat domain-containing protein [Burkholderiales bacterium]
MKKILLLLSLLALASMVSMNWMTLPSDTSSSVPVVAKHGRSDKAPVATQTTHTLAQFTGLWGNTNGTTPADKADTFDLLWARALSPAEQLEGKNDAQDQLRKLAQENPRYLKKLVALYDSETSVTSRELIISLLASIPSAETLALSRRLASSPDAGQRQAALSMLGNLNINLQEERELILLSLNNQQTPAVTLQALAALKAPAPTGIDAPPKPGDNSLPGNADTKTTAAVIRQLQSLTENPDASVRSRSISQLAQWDKNDSSLSYFSAALNDQTPEVRQAAIFALAQSGANAETVKQLLTSLVNNTSENTIIKTSARQVLERLADNKLVAN